MKKILDYLKASFPLLSVSGLVVGAILGYLYYIKVGCVSGTCAIQSNPYLMTIYGAVLGYLLFDLFARRKKKPVQENTGSEN